ncbi:DUF1292 domain-containing protein [Bacillus massiliglaciei]|uniref:DUF1292 domain-containing protein n=1 Tax=Bacillus massiliglaciei TaxID=1816693 RepID=UPI000A83C674|nr:DUF1292 domain-containing protein [Bacillus massiliglaciei]
MNKIEVGEILIFADENEEEQELEVLGTLEVEGTEYVAVGLVEEIERETEEDIDIFFFKVDAEGELKDIESEEEFQKVAGVFEANMEA